MRKTTLPRHTFLYFILLLALASLASLPRFGQRENEHASSISDSDFYLEMAHVFSDNQSGFTPEYTKNNSHHYNRPLLPWLAGISGHYFLDGNYRFSFSAINILAAAATAWLLTLSIRTYRPEWQFHWLPGLLFLFGFPQLNWGYHILTDTLGIATAFICTIYADWIIRNCKPDRRIIPHLAATLILSSAAFLARETGWLAVIATSFLLLANLKSKSRPIIAGCVIAVLLLGKAPHSIYEHYHGFSTPTLHVASLWSWNPVYWLDVFVKAGLCFHIIWLFLIWSIWFGWRKKTFAAPPAWMLGWSLGAVLYMAAVYAHNDIKLIGYPTRAIYSIFPIVYFWTASLFENIDHRFRPKLMALLLVIAQLTIALLGVYLDPGTPKITVETVLEQTAETHN